MTVSSIKNKIKIINNIDKNHFKLYSPSLMSPAARRRTTLVGTDLLANRRHRSHQSQKHFKKFSETEVIFVISLFQDKQRRKPETQKSRHCII